MDDKPAAEREEGERKIRDHRAKNAEFPPGLRAPCGPLSGGSEAGTLSGWRREQHAQSTALEQLLLPGRPTPRPEPPSTQIRSALCPRV